MFGASRGQADVLLDFDDYAVVIEAEFGNPAKADADKRLPVGAPAVVGGLPVRLVVAIGYPPRLADLPESETEANLAACDDLVIAYRYFGEAWGEETTGSVATLAEVLRDYWVQSDNGIGIEEIVKRAASAIEEAGDVLARVEPPDRGEQDGPATKALVWLNALLFQARLCTILVGVNAYNRPIASSAADRHEGFLPIRCRVLMLKNTRPPTDAALPLPRRR